MQVKLLRAIQERAIRPVGAQKEVPVDVRILSATHKPLAGLVEQGEFRQDLFYRINVIELHVAPLRERTEDIPLLIEYVLEKLAPTTGPKPQLSDSAREALCSYVFPGNVRELENILERALTLCDGNTIGVEDLRLQTVSGDGGQTATGSVAEQSLDSYLVDIEKQTIIEALEKTRWNKTAAARLLGISFRALRYRLEKLGLE